MSLLGLQDSRTPLTDISEEGWDTVLEVNLKGVFLFTRETLPYMHEQEVGNVINVSSGLGRQAIGGAGPYVSSKWG